MYKLSKILLDVHLPYNPKLKYSLTGMWNVTQF